MHQCGSRFTLPLCQAGPLIHVAFYELQYTGRGDGTRQANSMLLLAKAAQTQDLTGVESVASLTVLLVTLPLAGLFSDSDGPVLLIAVQTRTTVYCKFFGWNKGGRVHGIDDLPQILVPRYKPDYTPRFDGPCRSLSSGVMYTVSTHRHRRVMSDRHLIRPLHPKMSTGPVSIYGIYGSRLTAYPLP
jgi:hypothetical protein